MKRIRRWRSALRGDQIQVFQENARSQSALATQKAIQQLSWTTLELRHTVLMQHHQTFILFGMMKEALKGNHYASIIDVQRAAQSWLRQTPTKFYKRSFF